MFNNNMKYYNSFLIALVGILFITFTVMASTSDRIVELNEATLDFRHLSDKQYADLEKHWDEVILHLTRTAILNNADFDQIKDTNEGWNNIKKSTVKTSKVTIKYVHQLRDRCMKIMSVLRLR